MPFFDRFLKTWAATGTIIEPTDDQANAGFAFLGQSPPPVELFNAMFQDLDGKDNWLYNQLAYAVNAAGNGIALTPGDYTSLAQALALIGKREQVFTNQGVYPFVVPVLTYRPKFRIWGAGGGGGGCSSTTGCGVGGGGGGYLESYLVTTPGETLTISIGAPGAGGSVGTSGLAGTATTVSRGTNVLFSVNGGNGGIASTGGVTVGAAQGGAAVDNTGNAAVTLSGQGGAPGLQGTNAYYGGQGGACPYGGGGIGRTSNVGTTSDAGQYPGGGGNGGGEVAAGGAGGSPRLEILY